MRYQLFGTRSTKAGEPISEDDSIAVLIWLVVFGVWLITWLRNLVAGPGGEVRLPDIPAGLMALLAALPVSKAVAMLRKP